MQAAAPATEEYPSPHAVHDAEPVVLANVFVAHTWHVCDPVAPAYCPTGHAAQVVEPVVFVYVPAAHGVHAVAVPPPEYVPTGHCWQMPFALNMPAAQVTAVQLPEPASEISPDGHAVHDAAPADENVFAEHVEQLVLPVPGAYVPAAHCVHDEAVPPEDQVPAAHALHCPPLRN